MTEHSTGQDVLLDAVSAFPGDRHIASIQNVFSSYWPLVFFSHGFC